MKYSVLTAPIHFITEPTDQLRNPVETNAYYTEDPTVLDFHDEASAVEFIQGYLPFDKVIAFPGSRKGLEFYANVWAGKDELVLQDLSTLAERLQNPEDFNWEYGEDDALSLDDSIAEMEETQTEKTADDAEGYVVGSYLLGDSQLLNGQCSFMLSLYCELEFKDLTPAEQEQVITDDSKANIKVVVDSGKIFDIWCLRQTNGNVTRARILAYKMLYKDRARGRYYAFTSWFDNKWRRNITRLNQFRLKHNWY